MLLKLLIFLSITSYSYSQTFQNNYLWNQNNFHDLNIEPIDDNTGDVLITGNLFDSNMNTFDPVIMRIDATGNIVWTNTALATGYQNLRFFDSEVYLNGNMVAVTGSVDVSGVKKAFIATYELGSGLLIDNNYYEIVNPNFNSTALHISYTEADIDGDAVGDPGFIISGFFSNSYAVNTSFMNIGFVMRTLLNLTPAWTIEIDNTAGGTQDYNMANNVIETNDGYFITGASNDTNTSQQAVMAHKVDFFGNFMWDASYVYGNSQDVSVDAYFDDSSNKIYMLSNYSVSHHFGVTVIDNSTGNVSMAWVASDTNGTLDHYGFTIDESLNSPNNLVITGYNREDNFTDINGNSITSQSNVFVYEFDKSTGNQVGHSYGYLVPHQEPIGDEYNFWNGQLPLIYYPEIATNMIDVAGVNYHYVIGYKTSPSYTEANLFRTLPTYENACLFTDFNFIPNPVLNAVATGVISGPTPVQAFSMSTTYSGINLTATDCNGNVLGMLDTNELQGSYLYPNPAKDIIYTTANNVENFEIYNAQGKKVQSGKVGLDKSINLEALKTGLYFITIKDQSNNVQTFKVIKD